MHQPPHIHLTQMKGVGRKYLTSSQQKRVRERGNNCCWMCGEPLEGKDPTEYDHTIPFAQAVNGKVYWYPKGHPDQVEWINVNDMRNFAAMHKACHKKKTFGQSKATTLGSDAHEIAKTKRILGLTKTGPKQKIQGSQKIASRPMAGNKNSPFKCTFKGTIRRKN